LDRDSKSRAATNILITGGSQAWKLSAGFVLTIFSMRNLAPSDFGVLAMSATAATFLGLIKDLGVSQAIIQRPEITKGQIDASPGSEEIGNDRITTALDAFEK